MFPLSALTNGKERGAAKGQKGLKHSLVTSSRAARFLEVLYTTYQNELRGDMLNNPLSAFFDSFIEGRT